MRHWATFFRRLVCAGGLLAAALFGGAAMAQSGTVKVAPDLALVLSRTDLAPAWANWPMCWPGWTGWCSAPAWPASACST
jgi:hypothetical protein